MSEELSGLELQIAALKAAGCGIECDDRAHISRTESSGREVVNLNSNRWEVHRSIAAAWPLLERWLEPRAKDAEVCIRIGPLTPAECKLWDGLGGAWGGVGKSVPEAICRALVAAAEKP